MLGYTSFLEEPRYQVIERLASGIEVRRYEPRTFVESRVEGEGHEARREAFRMLFAYISGNDGAHGKISMTIPVSTGPSRSFEALMALSDDHTVKSDGYVMRFFLPAIYDAESAPRPAHPYVRVGTIPSRFEAVIRYAGSQSDELAETHKEHLVGALADSDWQVKGAPVSLFYNPPFSIPFLRRNEAAVVVEPGE